MIYAFWGDRSGTLEDPFGHVWMVSSRKKDMTPTEIQKAGEEAVKQMSKH
jgi:PhnB protein